MVSACCASIFQRNRTEIADYVRDSPRLHQDKMIKETVNGLRLVMCLAQGHSLTGSQREDQGHGPADAQALHAAPLKLG